jgi:hypothetical protein
MKPPEPIRGVNRQPANILPFDPTPSQIEEACLRIQQNWSTRTRRRRVVGQATGVSVVVARPSRRRGSLPLD